MKTIRCVLVDDERLARELMRQLLAAHPEFQIVGEAGGVARAVELVRQCQPDVIFLDIQMPGGGGFGLLEALMPDPPFVVFVTAFDRHALRAFEVNALDYLLKPVTPERLAACVARLKAQMCDPAGPGTQRIELPLLQETDQMLIEAGHSGCFIAVEDILYITKETNYSTVLLENGRRLIVRFNLSEWLRRLPREAFFNPDRTCIVQWSKVRKSVISSRGAVIEFHRRGADLELGRSGAERLREFLSLRGQ